MIEGPPTRWIAPSTPPPPAKAEFAAFTITSARRRVISPITRRNTFSPKLRFIRPSHHRGRRGRLVRAAGVIQGNFHQRQREQKHDQKSSQVRRLLEDHRQGPFLEIEP